MNDRNLRLQVVMSAIDKLTRPFKQARASTQELAASVKKSRDAITQLNQTSAKLDGFKKLQAENLKLGERLDYARNKASLMKQELDASGQPSQRQILALEKQRQAMQKLEERVSAATQKVSQMSQAVSGSAQPSQRQVLALEKQRQATQKLEEQLASARQKTSLMTQATEASVQPSQRQILALEKQRLTIQRLEERQGKLKTKTAQVRAELYRAGISANDGASATARITRETERYNRQLSENEARLRRAGEQQRKMTNARNQYSKTLEVRDRVAGAGAAMTGAGVAMGAPVVSAVKDYASLEDAMKGVAKQVNGLRDSNGNRTAQFYEMQAAIKTASEQLPMQNGAVDYAALVEGGARMGIGANATSWAEQKKQLLDFASTSAKAATAFELPADQLAENLGKIAQLYKVPISNIEQLGDVINYLDDNAMSKGADIIDVLQRMGDTADKLDYQKAAALGSTFLSLGSAPEVAASAAKAMVRELSIASIQSNRFQDGLDTLKLDPMKLQKSMVTDSMGTIMQVLEQVRKLPKSQQTSLLTQLFGKEFGDDATKLANNLPELRRQLELTQGVAAKGSMQKESDINKDSLSARWMLVKAGTQNVMTGLGETLRQPLMDIMDNIQRVTGAIRRWVERNPELAGTIMKVVAAVAALSVVLGGLMIGFAAVIGPMALVRLSLKTLGIQFIPTVISAVTRLGSGISWLARTPFTLLRGALSFLLSPLSLVRAGLMFIGSAMGVLLSPVTLLIAALAGVALVIWKYWQPIKAFLGGVVEGFSAAAAPILAAFAPLQPVFGWIGDKVKAMFGWFSDLLTPVKSTAAELDNAASMGKKFGEWLAAGVQIALTPLQGVVSTVSWLLEKMGVIKAESATLPKPGSLQNPTPPTVTQDGKVQLPPGGFPMMYPRLYDSGGYIPRGQLGIVGENGPELVNGPANITSRRRTAALAGATALAFGSLATPVAAKPLHPFSLPVQEYRESTQSPRQNGATAAPATAGQININIHPAPNQSPADIAREVARQLEELNRKAAARSRSSYKDQGDFDS